MKSDVSNIVTVARREYAVRIRTRSFVLDTLLVVAGVVAMAMVPLIIRAIDQPDGQRIGVHLGAQVGPGGGAGCRPAPAEIPAIPPVYD